MPFDWREFLHLAKELAGDMPTSVLQEAKLRTSISRAYYSAFSEAHNFLRDIDRIQVQRKNIHLFVSNQFTVSPDRTRRRIGVKLDRLKDLRVKADYEEFWPVNLQQQTRVAVNFAEKILSDLASLN